MASPAYRKLWRSVSRRVREATGNQHFFSTWTSRFGSEDDAANAFAIFSNWVTDFGSGPRRYGAPTPAVSDRDDRIARFDRIAPVSGRRVVELGPLEAGHTKQMLDLGATSVTSIESNPEAFLKCLVVKESLGLDGAKFVFGDANAVLARSLATGTKFDVCAAVGVLYHMQDPLKTIDLITRIAPVVYVWTHVASEDKPTGDWTELLDQKGRRYQARYHYYGRRAHLGGIARRAAWLTKTSLYDAFQKRGHVVTEIESGSHPHGDQVLFVSKTS